MPNTDNKFIAKQIYQIAEAQGDTSIENQTKVLISAIIHFLKKYDLTLPQMYPDIEGIQDVVKYLSEEFWTRYGNILINEPDVANRILEPHLKTIAILDEPKIKAEVMESVFDAVLGEHKETLKAIKDMTMLRKVVMAIITKTKSYAENNVQ